MPYVPNSPPVGKIQQPDVDKSLTKYHILKVEYDLVPGDPAKTTVRLKWSKGYEDGEGVYHSVERYTGVGSGEGDADLLAAINKVTTGDTIYGETKTAMWNFLLAKGKIEAGTIS